MLSSLYFPCMLPRTAVVKQILLLQSFIFTSPPLCKSLSFSKRLKCGKSCKVTKKRTPLSQEICALPCIFESQLLMFLDIIQFIFWIFSLLVSGFRENSKAFEDGRFCPVAWTSLSIMGNFLSRTTWLWHDIFILGTAWTSLCSPLPSHSGGWWLCPQEPQAATHRWWLPTPSLFTSWYRGDCVNSNLEPPVASCGLSTSHFASLNFDFSSVKWNDNTEPLENTDGGQIKW